MSEVFIVIVGVILGGVFAGVIPNPFKLVKDKRMGESRRFVKLILDIISDIL